MKTAKFKLHAGLQVIGTSFYVMSFVKAIGRTLS